MDERRILIETEIWFKHIFDIFMQPSTGTENYFMVIKLEGNALTCFCEYLVDRYTINKTSQNVWVHLLHIIKRLVYIQWKLLHIYRQYTDTYWFIEVLNAFQIIKYLKIRSSCINTRHQEKTWANKFISAFWCNLSVTGCLVVSENFNS